MLRLLLLALCTRANDDPKDTCPRGCTCIDRSEVFCSSSAAVDQLFAPHFGAIFQDSIRKLSVLNNTIQGQINLPSLNQLQHLDLSGNALNSFSTPKQSVFPSVVTLILRNNQLQELGRDAFLMFPNVEVIDLSHNLLSHIDWEAFRLFRLRRLVLSHNNLTGINEHMLRFTTDLEFLDVSYNRMISVQSSNFFAAQRLKSINFANNMIRRFDYDSFSPLYQLEALDLSYNDLRTIPGGELRQFLGLRVLRLDGNRFDRISEGDLVLPALQELGVSNSKSFRLIASNAFSDLPSLRSVDLSRCPNLVFISPYAFSNKTLLHRLNVSQSGLETVPLSMLNSSSHVQLDNNPLQCGCIGTAVRLCREHIDNLDGTTCSTSSGVVTRLSELKRSNDECRPEPLLPLGDSLSATVGALFSLFCASRNKEDVVSWRFPNGTQVVTDSTVMSSLTRVMDVNDLLNVPIHAGRSHLHQLTSPQPFALRPRILVTSEVLRFDVVTAEDSGEYRCSVRRGSHVSHRTIRLSVRRPFIYLYALEIGSHYATLAWNDSLKISATDRVRLLLRVKDASGLTSRTIQLSLHSPWFSYNVMRLKASQNYTFCLCYSMRDGDRQRCVLETCVDIHTLPTPSLFGSFSFSSIFIFFAVLFVLCALLSFRNIYMRFHVWQQQKQRSRMNQSISGQSFISTTSSTARQPSMSVTYENQLQMSLSQTASSAPQGRGAAVSMGADRANRLLTEDMAL